MNISYYTGVNAEACSLNSEAERALRRYWVLTLCQPGWLFDAVLDGPGNTPNAPFRDLVICSFSAKRFFVL